MTDYCKNCGTPLKEDVKFCPDCGEMVEPKPQQTQQDNKNKLIIIGLISVIAILAVGIVLSSGILTPEVPLETMDFGVFKMSVPVGAEFEEFTSVPNYGTIGGFIFLENVGNYSKEVFMLDVSTMQFHSTADEFEFDHKEGDITVYKDKTGQSNLYYVFKEIDEYDFGLMGEDKNTMVKMLNSIEITDNAQLKAQSSNQQTSTPTQSAPAPSSSMKIQSGSFSTGSAEEDKTYASIYVGKEHAGESVTVQIFYSRDGNSLNNGNMVPVTVHSDGYVEVASADAYHYYPDYASINLYSPSGSLLDSRSVSLSPTSGTQTF